MKHFWVAIEGADGVGKTTLAESLVRMPFIDNVPVSMAREPARGFVHYDEIVDALNGKECSNIRLAKLFEENRREQRARFADKDRAVIILDRSMVSTMVYQTDETLKMKKVAKNNKDCIPDLVIYLQLPENIRQHRLSQRSENNNYDQRPNPDERYLKAMNLLKRKYNVPHEIIYANSTPEELRIYTGLLISKYLKHVTFDK